MSNVLTRNITFKYVFALALIALLSISAYVILYRMVASQEDTAAVINVSGSQRWLSQRAASNSLRIVSRHNKAERERIRKELLQISNRMKEQQDGLIHGNSIMRLSGNPSPQVRAMYFNPPLFLDKQIHNYIGEIHALIHDADDKLTRNNPHLRYILSASASKLIQSLDAVVKQYQTECEANNIRLQKMEKGVLGFTMFVLCMEALFIFRPMILRIRRDTAKLTQSEEKFRLTVESSQDGILAYDKAIRYTLWNKAMEQIWGITSEVALGKTPFEMFPFLEEAGEGDSYRETIKGKTIKRSAMPYSIPQTGRCGYFESSHFPLYNTNGTLTGGMAIIRNATGGVQKERRLNAEHDVTRILAESATLNDASQKILQSICECLEWDLGKIWMFDRKAGVLRCGEIWHIPSLEAGEFTTVARQITFSPGIGLPGRIWASAKPAWIKDVVSDANFQRAPVAAKAGLHAAFGFPILIGNDVMGIIEFFSHEIREPDEHILNMISAIGSQIGQFIRRKEAESQIVKLSRAVEQSPNTILITDVKGNIEYVNPKGIQLTGYTPEEVIGKNPHIFKSGETSPEEYKRLWAIITSGGEWRGEFRNTKKNGKCYWEHASISPIKDYRGVITHFIAIKEDISERKRLEGILERKNKDLETTLKTLMETQAQLIQASKLAGIGVLAGGVAHEINNPLAIIMGYAMRLLRMAEELKDRKELDPFRNELKFIVDASFRCKKITDGILKFSRVSTKIEYNRVDLNTVIDDALVLVESSLKHKKIPLIKQLDCSLRYCMGNHNQLQQVFMNIINNAADAMPNGGNLIIATRENKNTECAEVEITDTGCGITEEHVSKIFDPFFTTKEPDRGMGLGLSISHGIIKEHNGRIEVKSTVGRGTSFFVILPIADK